MAAPDTLNSVTARKLSSVIASLWAKIKLLVTGSIQALDVSSVGGAGKYISAISETDGKISATETDIDDALSATSLHPVQNKELTRWHNIVIGEDGFVSGSSTNPQLSLQKSRLGALSLYNAGVNIKIYSFDENDEENATLEWDVSTASDSIKALYNKGEQTGTLYQSTAGKWVKILYTGTTSSYFRALGVFMDTMDSSSSVSLFYGHLRIGGVDYPESGQFSTWGSLVVAAYSKSSSTTVELILRPKSATCMCRIFGFRCLNTYSRSDAILIGKASSAFTTDKLATARKLKTKLDRTADSTFDGSADQLNIPVTGTLPVGNGGTGKASVTSGNYLVGNGTSALTEKTPKNVGNNVLTALDPGTDTAFFQDDEVLGSNHSGDATDTTKFVRRPVESLWNYIKGRISSVLGLSESNGVKTFTGNAATATDLAANSVLSVTKGGTGKSSVTSNSYLKGNGTGALVERTYAEVRTDLGLGSVYSKNVPSSGNASTTQVVMGNDTRLSDARTPTAHTHNTDAADVTDSPGSTVITDSTEFVTTNIYGYGDGDKKLYRRNFGSYIWPWIRSKLSSDTSVVVSGTAKEVGGTMVLEDSSDTRIGLIGVTTLGETTAVKYECLITVEATAGMGNNGSGIVLLAKGNARGTTAYNHSLSILNINKWNVRDYRPMIWNVSSGNGIVTMFGIWDASNNQLAPFTYSRVTVTKLTASEQNVNWLFTHDNGSWSESSTYLTTFASGAATELVDYSTSNINWRIRCGWDGPAISKVYPTPIQSTIQQTAYLIGLYTDGYTAYYKDVRAANVTVGNSLKWNGYDLVIGQAPTTPADNTIYIF